MATRRKEPTPREFRFGCFVRSLRRARGQTQEGLAELAGIASDTVRRLEHGAFSPSLDTLSKLVAGLRMDLPTLFTSFEFGERDVEREIEVMSRSLTPAELALALRLLAFLGELVGKIAATEGGEDLGSAASTLDREGYDGQ